MLGLRRFASFACVLVCLGCPAEGDENEATTTTPPATTTMPATDDGDDAPATTLPDPTNPTDPTDPGDSTGAPSADCCTAHAGGGCDDAKIEACVCEEDAVCCQFDWDALCVNTARTRCEACGGGGDESTSTTTGVADTGTTDPTTGVADTGGGTPGACCEASKMPGCSDAGVETCVCTQDDYCCMTAWDGLCVDQAVMDCGADCMFDTGCCVPHPSVGCDDTGVQDCVCAMDPFCCDRGWDSICVDEVDDFMCGTC